MRVLIGTTNPSKLQVFQNLLAAYDVELVSLTDLGIADEPDETGRDPAENAEIKAAYYGRYADYVVCNDAGLYFDALAWKDPRQPGLHIRSPEGVRLDDEAMIVYYSDLVHTLGGKALAYYRNGFAVQTPAGMSCYLESREEVLKEAFWMVDLPLPGRHPGWPLDSLSQRLDGTSFLEKTEQKETIFASERLETWTRFLITALGLTSLEKK